ncbi:MAG: tRNA (N6-threonylcarbamoyladenosine(37)-N6)-methyltransferase TrmO [Myxococcales bacterium]|nr:tRNA (N6-threonylcarbamoyladenosine(37)-N6)-methyltransferase TrmO [Myxococcales bacterium]
MVHADHSAPVTGEVDARAPIAFVPIGVARTALSERASAARQPAAAGGAEGRIELYDGRGFEDALFGLEGFSHLWLLYVFDRNVSAGFRPKVLPPRSKVGRVGVFATRSPHRPNAIGMSVVELVRVEGLVVFVKGVDLLDGTPILDIKPYVAYADAVAEASTGWLAADPEPPWGVRFSALAEEQLAHLEGGGLSLAADITSRLALGPQPHAYRRIKLEPPAEGGGVRGTLALKDWRVRFEAAAAARELVVVSLHTGYRPSQLAEGGSAPPLHRAFAARFS